MKKYKLGVDIGGTFTDVVLNDTEKGEYKTAKTPTTPKNLSTGVLNGLNKLVENLNEVNFFVHGTTVGLNALLERKGAKMALIVTKGFRDIYEIGRSNRPEIYNIQYKQPLPLLERKDIFEVDERTLVDGEIDTEINSNELEELIKKVEKDGYESISVCLLHSYKNPLHEDKIKDKVSEIAPNISVSLSNEVVREWREYERASTTIMNSYISPIMKNYLSTFESDLSKLDLEENLYIMQSNGGVMTSEIAKEKSIQTLMSGPVGGTMGGLAIGKKTDKDNLICIDMGGTSFDVSLILDGEADITSEADFEGLPVMSPMVNINTIGSGGGSIAWIEGGGLRVGPQSAGSDPGPACYGNGGTQATVTDANLILGRIDAEGFLGGDLNLDYEAAYESIESLSTKLGLNVLETAEGICDIANAKMADIIENLTISKGLDPRSFSLVSFGGAGPMHAALIAEKLGINHVLVPGVAGTFSAWGMLETDVRHDDVRTYISLIEDFNANTVGSFFKEMESDAEKILKQQKVDTNNMSFTHLADLRYEGQEYTLTVPFDISQTPERIKETFHNEHMGIYGHKNSSSKIEIVNLRLKSIGKLPTKKNDKTQIEKNAITVEPIKKKEVVWDNKKLETKIYDMSKLKYGNTLQGPAVIESATSTVIVPENFSGEINKEGNLELTKEN